MALLTPLTLFANDDCTAPGNKLVNGSFEQANRGVVTGWTLETDNSRLTSFDRANGYQVCGNYYGLITKTRGSTARIYQDVNIESGAIGVQFSAWGGIHDRCGAEFRLIFLNASGQEISSTRKTASVTKRVPGLQRYTLSSLLPSAARKVRVEASMARTQSQDGIYLKMEAALLTFEFPDPLPVSLEKFSATASEGSVDVKWQTTSEENAKDFEIQHSADGTLWTKIGTVASKGSVGTRSFYGFVHATPAAGNNYYRLKMVDLDESFEYSQLASVKISSQWASESSHFYPNPSRGEIKFEGKPEQVTVFAATGRRLFESNKIEENGRVDLRGLPQGIYLVKWTDSIGRENTKRLVITE